ncbi:MAG: ComEC/Rec2 family competence protein [[Clostridium] leptum]
MISEGPSCRRMLKAGHHGSNTSSAMCFNAVSAIAAVSCGQDNDYGHPHKEVLSRLSERGTAVYRTDLQAALSLRPMEKRLRRILKGAVE